MGDLSSVAVVVVTQERKTMEMALTRKGMVLGVFQLFVVFACVDALLL